MKLAVFDFRHHVLFEEKPVVLVRKLVELGQIPVELAQKLVELGQTPVGLDQKFEEIEHQGELTEAKLVELARKPAAFDPRLVVTGEKLAAIGLSVGDPEHRHHAETEAILEAFVKKFEEFVRFLAALAC